ncbi:ASCH/PUA domain-containing protein [Heyndrickxia sp. FSL W8-0496]|uniref:ASCH/PUA domain-containing protein n=1 Tax=Heyndrickxia sp. FSL W8-0496 TaxID=2954702 RepID=UPI0030FBDE45
MAKNHKLKILPQYFEPVAKRLKNFEIRKNDRDYEVGDLLLLQECFMDPEGPTYTGRVLERRIIYISDYEQKENYVVLGIK